MKKAIALFLVLAVCLPLVACGEPEPVVLTTENIDDYLAIKAYFDNYERNRDLDPKIVGYFAYGEIIIESYPVQAGSFQNVRIGVRCTIDEDNYWHLSSSDDAYEDEQNPKVINTEILLSAGGNIKDSHDLIANGFFTYPSAISGDIDVSITSVDGTFILPQ